MRTLLPLFLLALVACPDPTGAPGPSQDLDAEEETPPGQPAEAIAALPAAPGSAPGSPMADVSVAEGEGVLLSGTISYPGEKSGRVRVDFLKVEGARPPQLASTLELPQLGDWSLELPKEYGDVRIVGFIDQTGDGPSEDDPAAAWPELVTVGLEAVPALNIVLSDEPDLGALTPGGPPPDVPHGEGAPVGEPPPSSVDGPPGGEPGAVDAEVPAEGEPPPAEGAALPAEGAAPPAEGDAAGGGTEP